MDQQGITTWSAARKAGRRFASSMYSYRLLKRKLQRPRHAKVFHPQWVDPLNTNKERVMEGNIEAAAELIRDGLRQVATSISFFARYVVSNAMQQEEKDPPEESD